ncbi:hypothetical protein GCM10023165_27650 [Variovorax defluvii]|uniref:DUF4124 domain-containing protein n=1 Tax=Variovorax defluvii TaxID=913761 RepID=A0ABP8HU33_9BURK
MRPLLAFAVVALLAPLPAAAEVIRCTDTGGSVSYTDSQCPPGTKQVGRVSIQEPPPLSEADRQRQAQDAEAAARARADAQRREATAAPSVPAPQTSSGPIIIDGRSPGAGAGDAIAGRDDSRVIDDGYLDPGVHAPPARARDMRPRIQSCDGTGCRDTRGNHYNRSGQLDRYQSIDGKTCRPVGTTTLCR